MTTFPRPSPNQAGYPAYTQAGPRRSPPTTVIRLPSNRKNRARAGTFLMILLFSSGLLILCLLMAAIFGFYAYYQSSGRIVPGVSVGETSLSGMTLSEAAITLHERWNLNATIQASNGAQSQTLTPAELGLQLDALSTAQKAHNVAHGGSILAETAQMFAALKDGWQIEPVVSFDEQAARTRLDTLAPSMSQPAVDASIRLDGTTLTPLPSALGYTVNVDATIAALAADPGGVLTSGKLAIIPQPVLPKVSDVTPAMAEAQRLMDTPVNIQGYDPILNESLSWDAPREVVGSWLKAEAGEDGPQIILDETKVAAYLNSLNDQLGPDRYLDGERFGGPLAEAVRQGKPLAVTISYRSTTYVVQPGETLLKIGWKLGMPYWMIVQANSGLDPENVPAGTELVVPPKTDLLPLPVIPNKRIVMSISKQRMWVYQDGQLLFKFVISTGIDRSPTQPGIFQVQTHDPNAYASVWDLYMPNFLGIYQAWPGFMNGIHGLPTLSNGQRLWANILGSPASYGCIILNLDDAEWLYNWAEDGVVVEIQA
jgi:LysM repeat protein